MVETAYIMPRIKAILADVEAERRRQIGKWGVQTHTKDRWLAILVEEVGELAKAVLEGTDNAEEEAIQVAAVAAAIAESYSFGDPV